MFKTLLFPIIYSLYPEVVVQQSGNDLHIHSLKPSIAAF